MDYLDKVYSDLIVRAPGRYPLADLKEPERFIDAVKELIDGDWLHYLYFSNDYSELIIPNPILGKKT